MRVKEITVSYRKKSHGTPKITGSSVVIDILRKHWQKDISFRERTKVMYLDAGNNCLGIYEAGAGSINACVMDARQILGIALKVNALSVILAHNHPSGNTQPSHQDERLTENMKQAGKILGVNVLDHVILTESSYYSFADDGKM